MRRSLKYLKAYFYTNKKLSLFFTLIFNFNKISLDCQKCKDLKYNIFCIPESFNTNIHTKFLTTQ